MYALMRAGELYSGDTETVIGRVKFRETETKSHDLFILKIKKFFLNLLNCLALI